ncbi:hypothetical protein DFJ73DRAFT_854906, partial [Zopfochytrium polystomum]
TTTTTTTTAQLRRRYVKDEEPEVCPICTMAFEPRQSLKRLPCKHVYHEACIDEWLLSAELPIRQDSAHTQCPLCRRTAVVL